MASKAKHADQNTCQIEAVTKNRKKKWMKEKKKQTKNDPFFKNNIFRLASYDRVRFGIHTEIKVPFVFGNVFVLLHTGHYANQA